MKQDFVITKNVSRFLAGMEVVAEPVRGVVGMALVFGPPGSGKSEVADWYRLQHDYPFVRAYDGMSRRALMSAVVAEIGQDPAYQYDSLLRQACDYFLDQGRHQMLIVDEVDYLVKARCVEALRDLNDMTNVPVVMIGMQTVDRKIKRYPQLYDRCRAVVRFDLFDETDIRAIADKICEATLDDSTIHFIRERGQGKLRLTNTWISRAERMARQNRLETVTAAHLKTLLRNGG